MGARPLRQCWERANQTFRAQTHPQQIHLPKREQNRTRWKIHYEQEEKCHLTKKTTNLVKLNPCSQRLRWALRNSPIRSGIFSDIQLQKIAHSKLADIVAIWPTIYVHFFPWTRRDVVWAYYSNPACHLAVPHLLLTHFCNARSDTITSLSYYVLKMFSAQWLWKCLQQAGCDN